VFPEASRDGDARLDFLANLNGCLGGRVLPKVREAYERKVKPDFAKAQGRAPANRHEVRRAMPAIPRTRRGARCAAAQWRCASRSAVRWLRQLEAINRKAAELSAGSRQLQLNRAVKGYIACALRIMLLETKAVERAASGADQPIEQAMNDLRHA
jgi:hypothetical protein